MRELLLLGRRWTYARPYRLANPLRYVRRPGADAPLLAVMLATIIALNHHVGPTFAFGGPYSITVCAAAWLTGFRPALAFGIVAIGASVYLNGAGGPYAGAPLHTDTAAAWASVSLRALSLLIVSHLIAGVRTKYNLVQQQARRDPLTGLHNHCAFHEHLDMAIERAARGGTVIALAYLDLDDFKGLNDRFGHLAGDRMLVWFAQAAQAGIRRTDCIGRLGGDEFAIVIEARTKAEATLAVSRAHDALKIGISGREQIPDRPLSFSMGAVIAGPLDRLDANSLVHAADSLMYRSKRTARGSLTISDLGLPGSAVCLPLPPFSASPVSFPAMISATIPDTIPGSAAVSRRTATG
ncbi:hypothetical protein BH10PSE12_BH10PSE12_21560 [soil metagenome]